LILLVHSSLDVAGVNIANQMLKCYPFTEAKQIYQEKPVMITTINNHFIKMVTLKEESVNAQYLQHDFPEADLVVFLSRHSSQSGKPTLTVHVPGNFAEAELGGLPKKVSVAPAVAMQTTLKALVHYKEPWLLNYEVSYEATHHGPSLNMPSMFVELGSSEAQWSDESAARVVADAAMTAIVEFGKPTECAVLGIGGQHYNAKFTLMALMGEAVFAHMIPKHAVPNIDVEMVAQCMAKTYEKVTLALLDWKGIRSEDKTALLDALEAAHLPYKKV
jgi:D-aminoacyl-tRNA deacylase